MKVIDQTPFYNNETGTISLIDRGKAMMKFGSTWIGEMEAQKAVIPVMDSILDKSYTLLRNVTPPGLEASIPFILIGPTGIYVIYVTNMTGMYRAKGDQWGTISGNTFKALKPNLLSRTDRMARAIQIFLQRNKYGDLTMVEAVLLCAEAGAHVDSLRPIVRVVMRDALERFAVSISQAHVSLSPEAVHDIASRLSTPARPAAAQHPAAGRGMPAAAAVPASQEKSAPGDQGSVPAFNFPDSQTDQGTAQTWSADRSGFDYQSAAPAPAGPEMPPESPTAGPGAQPTDQNAAGPFAQPQENPFPFPDTQPQAEAPVRKGRSLTRGQVMLLVIFAVVELLLLAVFGYIVISSFV